MSNEPVQIVDAEDLRRTVTRLAYEIVEKNHGIEGLALLGIRSRGVPLAERLREAVEKIEGVRPPLGSLDVTMYRDDVFKKRKKPQMRPTEIDFEISGKKVVLVDDVLYTGRTVRAALDAVIDFGRPHAIQLAVIIDRGLRELPIQADYIGQSITTSPGQEVKVHLQEVDGDDGVWLVTAPEEA